MAWKYLNLSLRLRKKAAKYDNCPQICGQTEKKAAEFCSGCPIRKEDERFRRETLSALSAEAGDDWKEYGFDYLQKTLFAVLELEDEPDLYVGTEVLVNIVKSERNKIQRIEHQNLMNGFDNASE